MIHISEEQVWDAASVGIDIMALLAGSAIVALLVALLAIWLIAWLVKKIDPKFSESVKAWRTELAFGGAIFASTFIFLQVAAYNALVVKKDISNVRPTYDWTLCILGRKAKTSGVTS